MTMNAPCSLIMSCGEVVSPGYFPDEVLLEAGAGPRCASVEDYNKGKKKRVNFTKMNGSPSFSLCDVNLSKVSMRVSSR